MDQKIEISLTRANGISKKRCFNFTDIRNFGKIKSPTKPAFSRVRESDMSMCRCDTAVLIEMRGVTI